VSGCDSVRVAGYENLPPDEFLRLWEEATRPTVDGRPVLRYALLHPDRTPLVHTRVQGVPDDVLDAWYEDERHEDETLEELAARHGGSVEQIPSRAARLAMVREEDGSYRVLELDAAGRPTGFDVEGESLHGALRGAALAYGFPAGTLCWKEMAGNRDD
jgi:hypothetical protein